MHDECIQSLAQRVQKYLEKSQSLNCHTNRRRVNTVRIFEVIRALTSNRMVEEWLVDLMRGYNNTSLQSKNDYAAVVFMDGKLLNQLILDGLKALPDEILVGLDYNSEREIHDSFLTEFAGNEYADNLFAGQKYIIDEAMIVNRGDSYSVHHLPEDWTDDMFSATRGSRRSRFTHFLHTHPNAPAIPSHADADAAQETPGVDMILGLRFSPEGPLPWFDDVEGRRRSFADAEAKTKGGLFSRRPPVIGRAPTGHFIHDIQLIAFHKRGFGINIVLVDENGIPY